MENKKIVSTIECRMGSTRLPGKVMLGLPEKPGLQIIVERLRKVKQIDEVVLATTDNKKDDVVASLAKKIGCSLFRGSEEDVLDRIFNAAEQFSADIVVEITGDCPLIDPEIVSQVIDSYLTNKCDYCANDLIRAYPMGMDVQVFSFSALERAHREGLIALDREHVSHYIRRNPKKFCLLNLPAPPSLEWPQLRLTLDEKDDYKLLLKIQKHFLELGNEYPSCLEIVSFLKENPHLVNINKHVIQKKV